jgi:polyhydroxyalkanoate synthesis regulator phasin
MAITLEHIITIFAVVGSALTIYFNLKKFGDNIKKESEWRTSVNHDMKNLLEKVTELLEAHKVTTNLVKDLMEARIRLEGRMEIIEKEQSTVWRKMDERKENIDKLYDRVSKLEGR